MKNNEEEQEEQEEGQEEERMRLEGVVNKQQYRRIKQELKLMDRLKCVHRRKLESLAKTEKLKEMSDTPRTKMERMFYEKYRINPLETLNTMRNLKKINMQL